MTAHILISSSGCPSRLRPSSFLQKRSIGAVSRSKEKHRDQCEIATGMNLHNASRRTLLDDESKGAHTFQRLDRHFAPFPMRSQEGCELQQDLLGSLVCWSERAFDRDETPLSPILLVLVPPPLLVDKLAISTPFVSGPRVSNCKPLL